MQLEHGTRLPLCICRMILTASGRTPSELENREIQCGIRYGGGIFERVGDRHTVAATLSGSTEAVRWGGNVRSKPLKVHIKSFYFSEEQKDVVSGVEIVRIWVVYSTKIGMPRVRG